MKERRIKERFIFEQKDKILGLTSPQDHLDAVQRGAVGRY